MKNKQTTDIQYSASGIAEYISNLEMENARLTSELNTLRENSVNAEKFYGAPLSLNTVALLQGVDPRTIKNYVELGAIPIHPDSTDGRTYIRGSVALKIDFSKLKREYLTPKR